MFDSPVLSSLGRFEDGESVDYYVKQERSVSRNKQAEHSRGGATVLVAHDVSRGNRMELEAEPRQGRYKKQVDYCPLDIMPPSSRALLSFTFNFPTTYVVGYQYGRPSGAMLYLFVS